MTPSTDPVNQTVPLVSVVIPAHNEAEYISDCVNAVLNAGHPLDRLEVLVVDHASTDATGNLARRAGATVLPLNTGRIGKVRNTGFAAAHGDYVAFVDADCLVPPSWLKSAVSLLEADPTIGAVGGPCLSPKRGNWIENALAPSSVATGIIRSATALATSSLIVRTRLLNEVGCFDETLISGEDDDLSNRIRRRGLTLGWISDCYIIHRGYPKTYWGVVRKEIWHGSNHIEVRSGYDLTLLLTIIFLLACFSTIVLAPIALLHPRNHALEGLALSLIVQVGPPILYALKRIKQWPRDWYLFPRFVIVAYAYFLGHGLGVLANGWRKLLRTRTNA